MAKLRTASIGCEFQNVSNEISQQILQECVDLRTPLKRLIMTDQDRSLPNVLRICRQSELIDNQIKADKARQISRISNLNNEPVMNSVAEYQALQHPPMSRQQQPFNQSSFRYMREMEPQRPVPCSASSSFPRYGSVPQNICRKCGRNYPHVNTCPADGKSCNKCHAIRHFVKMCGVRGIRRSNQHQQSSSRKQARTPERRQQHRERSRSREENRLNRIEQSNAEYTRMLEQQLEAALAYKNTDDLFFGTLRCNNISNKQPMLC